MIRSGRTLVSVGLLSVGLLSVPTAQAQQTVPAANELVNFMVTGTTDCRLDVTMTNPTNAPYRMDYLLPGQVLQSVNGSYPRGSDGPVAEPAGTPEQQWLPGGTGPAFTTFPDAPRVTEGAIDVGATLENHVADEITVMVRIRRGPDALYINPVARDFNPYTLTGCSTGSGGGSTVLGSLELLFGS